MPAYCRWSEVASVIFWPAAGGCCEYAADATSRAAADAKYMTRFIDISLKGMTTWPITLLELQLLAQHRFENFAGAAQRQRLIAQTDRSRTLVAGDQPAAVGDHLGLGHRLPRFDGNDRVDALAP